MTPYQPGPRDFFAPTALPDVMKDKNSQWAIMVRHHINTCRRAKLMHCRHWFPGEILLPRATEGESSRGRATSDTKHGLIYGRNDGRREGWMRAVKITVQGASKVVLPACYGWINATGPVIGSISTFVRSTPSLRLTTPWLPLLRCDSDLCFSIMAARITTATSKLRDITKMERIGGRFDASCLGNYSLGFAGVHSNIYGLELDDRSGLRADYQGMVGQAKAAGMILTMVQEGRIAGRAMLFARPPST
ncbi:hypothetical protein ARMGADRAFT_1036982 [Armillaria gallica]|uniref:TIP49 P-loop domain-containing protein n=1 Tax=Armillaria gallica TaxID=47427 RepID=A0A2H3D921_ARMGA|nr:hypothetical protein ARMGADRAFT_1036982 [Armillaria gallica]